MSNHSYNSWLKTKKKPELAQLAQQFGLQEYVCFHFPRLRFFVYTVRATILNK